MGTLFGVPSELSLRSSLRTRFGVPSELAAKGAAAAPGTLAALAATVALLLVGLDGCNSQIVDDTLPNDAGQEHWSAAEALATVTGIDGTWDITFTHHPWYSGGSLIVGDTIGTGILTLNEENMQQGPNCTYVESRDKIDLTLAPGMVTGVNTHLRQVEGIGCPVNLDPGTYVDQEALPGMDTGMRMSTGSSAFGLLGGVWHATSPYGACDVTFKDSVMSGTCTDGTTFMGTLSPNGTSLSGRSSDGFEFAAQRR
ncbi:MAG TPA: hypothetical protein VKU41_15565 [Polyangiaceae bacterium]|nr:hypothetical protein [Polyangiaceae bacterium]